MLVLILGLAIFLGVHSIRIVADGWRSATIERIGESAGRLCDRVDHRLRADHLGYGIARQGATLLWCRLSACATSLAC